MCGKPGPATYNTLIMALEVVVLAAGTGTRMRSAVPKVLHNLAGRPLLAHVLDTIEKLDPSAVHVVYGHGGDAVPEAFADRQVNWVLQAQQLGTGHAVQQAVDHISDASTVLVVYGDVPLVSAGMLQDLASAASGTLAVLTAHLADPTGYGRVLRNGEAITGVVEEKDADAAQKKLSEINTGFLAAPAAKLKTWLQQVGNDNAQGEHYLTDVIALAAQTSKVLGRTANNTNEILGVNSLIELAQVERIYQVRRAQQLMLEGVAISDPQRFDARGEVTFGSDCAIDINVVLEGPVNIGSNVSIGPNVVIRRSVISDNVVIHPNCVIEDATVGNDCLIGPFARIRPGAALAAEAHIGNFVEIKNSQIGKGSKVNHLAYIGDSSIGENVNIGAGAITCNYDGANKHRTKIGDDVFVGSNSQLVAPVSIGEGATVAAGSTITNNVPAGALAVSRSKQRHIAGWKRPRKDSKK